MSTPLKLLAAGAAAGSAALGYALWEARQYTLRRLWLDVLPAGSPDLRVLHLSDLHLARQDRDRIDWVIDQASWEPDLVVVTGDFMSGEHSLALAMEAMSAFAHVPGLFVFGSNDYFAAIVKNPLRYFQGPSKIAAKVPELPWRDLSAQLCEMGWTDLNNASARLQVKGLDLDCRGVDDPHINRDRYEEVAGPFAAEADLRLGVTHSPYISTLTSFADDGADLIFAGHTHGGQVCIPGYGALVTNCDLDRGRAKGLSRWPRTGGGESLLHVSAGLGTSPYSPIRVACRPEASMLTLSAKRS